jgi:Subtilase family
VIPDDGDVYGDHVLNALAWVGDLRDKDDERVLARGDVVCLPACFRPQLPTDNAFQNWLAEATLRLGDGVTLVAAAGNDGSDELVYPAAFTTWAKGSAAATDSVGALNTDGKTKAYYSNFGDWVTCWQVGTSLVSAFPGINGARAPELTAGDRRSTDPDDFTGGFARWSGTSFAAAVHAGKLAQKQLPAALQER